MKVCARMIYIEIVIAQSHTHLYIVLFLSTNPNMKLATIIIFTLIDYTIYDKQVLFLYITYYTL